MEDQLISDETGILAKQKGFNEFSVLVRYLPPKIDKTGWEIKGYYTKRKYEYYKNKPKDNIERVHLVSQSLLQKWLREKHNIHVVIWWYDVLEKYYFEIGYKNKHSWKTQSGNIDSLSNTYEEALEAALLEGLKLI